jgi:hypothetical protein
MGGDNGPTNHLFFVIPMIFSCHSHENGNPEAFLHSHVNLNSESKKKHLIPNQVGDDMLL